MMHRASHAQADLPDSEKTLNLSDVLQTISNIICLMEMVSADKGLQTEIFTLYHLYARCAHLDDIQHKLASGEYQLNYDIDEKNSLVKEVDSNFMEKDLEKHLQEMSDLLKVASASLEAYPDELVSVKKIYDYNAKKNLEEIARVVDVVRRDTATFHLSRMFSLKRLKSEEKIPADQYPLIGPGSTKK